MAAYARSESNRAVYDVVVHGPERRKQVVSVECARELRTLLTRDSIAEITRPMVEPAPDVFEDLWQMSHVTAGYVGRASGGASRRLNGRTEDGINLIYHRFA